jgi:hypothetical protein
MVLKKKNGKSKAAMAATAAATFGVAMSSMYLATDIQADVLDMTFNGGNAMDSNLFVVGSGLPAVQNIDQMASSSRNFAQFNDQFNGTGRTLDFYGSLYGGGSVFGLQSALLVQSGDVLDPATFEGSVTTLGAPVGAFGGGTTGTGGGTFDGSGSAFVAFRQQGTDNLGWFKLTYSVGQAIIYGPGQIADGGETLTVGAIDPMGCDNPLGDVNGDGIVDLLDVAPFVDAITNGLDICEADVNEDEAVDLLDVAPFVDILLGG